MRDLRIYSVELTATLYIEAGAIVDIFEFIIDWEMIYIFKSTCESVDAD